MKSENYQTGYNAWKTRLEKENPSFEKAVKRLKYIEDQISSPFSPDEYLSATGRIEILSGRKDAVCEYIKNKL